MKTLIIITMTALFAIGTTYAGENPQLLKEIKRKAILDLSKVDLDNDRKEFVIVKFKVTNQQIEIIEIQGSKEELTNLMMKKLEEMVIYTDAKDATTYQYKFNFEKE